MTKTLLLAIGGATLLMSGAAQAFSLTNREATEQRLQMTIGDEEPVTQDLILQPGQTLDELCEEGCVIALENGTQESYEGDEDVIIENGLLNLAE